MTIKQLENYPYLKARVRRLPEEISDLKGSWAVCGAVLASRKSAPYNLQEIIIGGTDTTQEARYQITEKQGELEAALCDIEKIESYINNISDVRIKEILVYRYVYGETWEEVARHFGYHESADSCRMSVKRFFEKSS